MNPIDRRSFLGVAGGAGALPLLAAAPAAGQEADGASAATATALLPYQEESRARRMKWWHDAKFGMFIHYGLYSIIGHQEWVMESEGIPIPDYEKLAGRFAPKPGAAREWARLAKRAGQRYMVLTTKHHEGFCLWDSIVGDERSGTPCAREAPGGGRGRTRLRRSPPPLKGVAFTP
ncbi:alpha-L-fucosidase, partial [Sphingomonas sp.]